DQALSRHRVTVAAKALAPEDLALEGALSHLGSLELRDEDPVVAEYLGVHRLAQSFDGPASLLIRTQLHDLAVHAADVHFGQKGVAKEPLGDIELGQVHAIAMARPPFLPAVAALLAR